MTTDTTPRYTPESIRLFYQGRAVRLAVLQTHAYPPGQHPAACPLRKDWTAVELKTAGGSRWYGCQEAYIGSSLRMVVVGFDDRFEEMRAWELADAMDAAHSKLAKG